MTTLSPSQQDAEKAFAGFLLDPQQKELVISGFAGSGKSFLIQHLYRTAVQMMKLNPALNLDINKAIHFTATTNKAAEVLADMLGVYSTTIHALLGLKVTNDYKTGKVKLQTTDRTQKIHNGLIFVDEASMVDAQLLDHIRVCIGEGTKVVFVGDRYQLAPVKESHSIVFHRPRNIVHLTEIQRQLAGNPIIDIGAKFRDILDERKGKGWPEIRPDNKHVFVIDGPEFQELVEDRYLAKHEPDDVRILAWSNERVIAYNSFVRDLLGLPPDRFEPGEVVVANSPVFMGDNIIVPTDGVVHIKEVEAGTDPELDIDGYWLKLNEFAFKVFQPQSWERVNRLARHYAKHKDWRTYFYLKERLVDLRPVHALTVHKSQGSTYREVFIDLDNIGRNTKREEIARLVYVASSRASERVYFYGSLPQHR